MAGYNYRKSWMTDAQWRCAEVAAKYAFGFHHVHGLQRWGDGIAIDATGMIGDLSTYDFSALTRLVVLAHDECVRIGIKTETREQSHDGYEYEETVMIITFHPRVREGKMSERHPTLEDHVRVIRTQHNNPHKG